MKQWFGKLMATAFVLFSLCLTVWAEEAQAVGEENWSVTFTAKTREKVYNGRPLDARSEHTLLKPFNYVERVYFTTNEITEVGVPVEYWVTNVVIRNGFDEDVTASYNISYEPGTMKILPRKIELEASDSDTEMTETELTYDGQPHSLKKVYIRDNGEEDEGLAKGDTLTYDIPQAPITNVTASPVLYEIKDVCIKNTKGEDVTSCYSPTYFDHKLTINKRAIKIYPVRKDDVYTRDYNGAAFEPDGWDYVDKLFTESDRLVAGDTLVPVYVAFEKHGETEKPVPVLTNVNEVAVQYRTADKQCTITNATVGDVTGNYNIDGDPSYEFWVEPAGVTIKSKTAEMWYTGDPLSCHEFETFKGFAPGEGFAETNNWASQTEVGYCQNTFDYKLAKNTNTNNYEFDISYGYLIVFERWRIKYDLAGGDFVTTNQAWKLDVAEPESTDKNAIIVSVKLTIGDAPVREGYDFLGWTNDITKAVYQPNSVSVFDLSSDVRFFELTALWKAKDLPQVKPTTEWDDKIQWYKTLDGEKQTTKSLRDITMANTTFTAKSSEYYSPMTNALIVQVRIKAPKYITNAERAAAVKFNVDGTNIVQGALSPIGYEYPTVKFHEAEPGKTEEYYYIEWYAYVRPGEMNKALADNEVGSAFGDTTLYCNWNNEESFDTAYTVKFDADTCKLYEDDTQKKMIFPLVQELVWNKGYQPGDTRSEVTKESWDKVLQYKFYTNTVDLTSLEGVNDLVRTGYVQQAWDPEVTRGYAVLMRDTTEKTNVVEMTANWDANEYDADLVLGKIGVTIDEEYEIPTDWTVEDEDFPFALPTPEQVLSKGKLWGLNYWTNQFGKAVTKIDLESVGTNDVEKVPFGAVLTGIVYKISYNMTNGFANIDKPGTPYVSHKNNIEQYSAETNEGAVVTLNAADCFGCKFEGWERSDDGEIWHDVTSFSPMGGKDFTLRARWTEYQAMVVEHDTATTNYFTVVADAIAAVKNSNTTIAFLDAKGDGIQDPVEIKIPASLTNIVVNFCTLSYTNATGEAALNIGDNADVRVENLPGFIGLEGASVSRLVQTNGLHAVKVGEGATFTLDDKNIVLDVDDREYVKVLKEFADRNYQFYSAEAVISCYNPFISHIIDSWHHMTYGLEEFTNFTAKCESELFTTKIYYAPYFTTEKPYEGVTYETTFNDPEPFLVERWADVNKMADEIIAGLAQASNDFARVQFYTNAVVIAAPESATLNLIKGSIGGTASGLNRDAASIDWTGHDQYLYSSGLNFATKPRQDRAEGWSQVKAGYIWTTNGVEDAEFPFTITQLGPISEAETIVKPGEKIVSTKAKVKGVFWVEETPYVSNAVFAVQNPTGINEWNSSVVNDQVVSSNAVVTHVPFTSVFAFGYYDPHFNSFTKMLVETMEQQAPTNVVVSYDWDGVAGVENAYTYTLAFDANTKGDIIISNRTSQTQVFPYIAKITYTQSPEVIETNKLVSTYTIYDTIRAPGLKLEPEIGWYTNVEGATYRFDGWYDSSTLVTNLVHETGKGQSDVNNITLRAALNKVVWDALDEEGKLVGKATDIQDAMNMLPEGGTIRFFGDANDALLHKPLVGAAQTLGAKYTIDLGGRHGFVAADDFEGDFIFEIQNALSDVVFTNGWIGVRAQNGEKIKVGGILATLFSNVTVDKSVTITTEGPMVKARSNAYLTLDGAQLLSTSTNAAALAEIDATLVFTNMTYQNIVRADYGAEVRVFNSKLAPDVVDIDAQTGKPYGKQIFAIIATDGAKVYLGYRAQLVNSGDLQTVILLDSKLTVNDPVTYHTEDEYVVPDWQTISNEKGAAIFASLGTWGSVTNAEVDLRRGYVWANAQVVQLHAGKLTATNIVEGVDGFKAVSRGTTLLISNDQGVLEPGDIKLWSGMYESVKGEALLSSNGESGEKFNILSNFVNCALLQQPASAGIKNVKKGALFSTPIRRAYLADGYMGCSDDEVIKEFGDFWYFIKTIPYKVDYDLDGGAWAAGAKTPITSYDVEMSMNDYQDYVYTNAPTRANYYFRGWLDGTGATQDVITVNVGMTGDLSFTAIWQDNPCTVKIDYTGSNGYPKYTYVWETKEWYPSQRYPKPVWVWDDPEFTRGHWTDEGVVVSPTGSVTFDAPASYSGFTFRCFEDVVTGRKYMADTEYRIGDFTFDPATTNTVNLRGVWETGMGIMDDQGNMYVTLEDAITNEATKAGTVLRVIGDGEVFTNPGLTTIVIDKDITLDLNDKILAIPQDFLDDTLIMITNALNAKVINGGLAATTNLTDDTIAPIKIVADEQPVKALDSSWELVYGAEIPADYIKDGFQCVKDASEWWYITTTEQTLTFEAGDLGVRTDLTVTTNNVDRTFTCEGDPIVLKDAERVGFNFCGWYDGSKLITDGIFNPKGVSTSVTLTAIWTPVVYNIEYVLNEGSIEGERKIYTCEGTPFELVTPARTGYAFAGWKVNGLPPANPCVITPTNMTGTATSEYPALGTLTAVAVWEADCYTITFDTLGGKSVSDLRYNDEMLKQGQVVIPAAEKVGCKFISWVDAQGNEVKPGTLVAETGYNMSLTAVYERSLWTGDTSVIDGNLEGDGRGQYFTGNVTYTGWLTHTITGAMVGKVTITAGKPNSKGLCTVTMTTSVIVGEGKTYTLKNTAVPVGEVQDVVLTGGTKTSPINAPITISNNGVEGLFGFYAITASADRFATNVTKIPAATLAYLQGNWTLAFQAADRCHGATTLKLAVAAKGKVTITGNLGDGTAISTTSQLIYGDGTVICPVVINAYTGKKGGFAFNLWFTATGAGDNLHDEIDVTDLSNLIDADGNVLCYAEDVVWTGTRVAETVTQPSYVFGTDLTDFEAPATAAGYWPYELVLPPTTNVSFTADILTGKFTLPKASTVKIDATSEEGDVTFTNPNKDGKVNDLGLALTYTPSTGALTGSMKVYFKAQNIKTGKWILKTVTAKVYGVMVGNFACCAAVEKSIGSAPANLVSGRLLDLQDCGAVAIGGQRDGLIMITTAIYGARAANGAMLIVTPWIAK